MNHPLYKTQLLPSTSLKSAEANPDFPTDKPHGPTLLNRFARCCRKITASAVTKNLAGVMIGTGAGATFGCPWVIGLLIGAGVGTSWIGGLGIALIGAGIILWTVSAVLSARKDDACDHPVLELGFSAFMGVVGIPYVIGGAILDCCNSVCCDRQSDDDDYDEPAQKKIITPADIVEYTSKMTLAQRKDFIQRCFGLDLPASVRSDASMPRPPALLSKVPGQLLSNPLTTASASASASTSGTSELGKIPESPSASKAPETNQDMTGELYIS